MADSFMDFVFDQLHGLEGLEARAMFGGHGLYLDEVFFGIFHRDRLYFKTDEDTRARFIEYGMKPFRPSEKQTLSTYYEVPVDILEDHDALREWALEAVRVARGS